MASDWYQKLSDINTQILQFKKSKGLHDLDMLIFRGHNNSDKIYRLLPAILREENFSKLKSKNLDPQIYEQNSFAEFKYNCRLKFEPIYKNWDILFLMQHYGIPTRLLDWTENINIALYFAIKGTKKGQTNNAHVWVLDPFQLNRIAVHKNPLQLRAELVSPDSCPYDYEKCFAQLVKEKFEPSVMAIYPPRDDQRLASQSSVFTFHNGHEPLDELTQLKMFNPLLKIEIEPTYFEDAKTYLKAIGINERFVFPGLEGLARHIKEVNFD